MEKIHGTDLLYLLHLYSAATAAAASAGDVVIFFCFSHQGNETSVETVTVENSTSRAAEHCGVIPAPVLCGVSLFPICALCSERSGETKVTGVVWFLTLVIITTVLRRLTAEAAAAAAAAAETPVN